MSLKLHSIDHASLIFCAALSFAASGGCLCELLIYSYDAPQVVAALQIGLIPGLLG